MRFKNIADTDVASLVKKGDYSILPYLFERNYVSALNVAEKHDFAQTKVQKWLSNSVVIVWQYFSIKSFQVSKHKIDFMIDYVFRVLIQTENPQLALKIKSRFEELDPFISRFLNEPTENEEINTLNNYKLLKDTEKQLIWNHFFEKRTIEKIGSELGIDEEKAQKKLNKGFIKWAELIKQNLNKSINTQLLTEHTESILNFSNASLSNEKMLAHELILSQNPDLLKLQEQVDKLGQIASLSRRLSLIDYISKNASTKLTGNIWGNKVSIYSAIFIALIGILVWISDHTPDDKKDIFNLKNNSVTDTLKINDANNKIP